MHNNNNNNNRRNNYGNNRRFKNNNNNNNRRYNNGGSKASSVDDESNLTTQQRKNFANKRDQLLEKAKDLLRSGERIEAENFFQHAEHCFRMMNSGLNGARFDPYRGHTQHNNQQNDHANGEQNQQHEHNNSVSNQEDNNSSSSNSTDDIAALPFMQPIEHNERNPRVIE